MTIKEIARQESARLVRGMVPLTLLVFAGMTLFGYGGWRTAVSLLLGDGFALVLFLMICASAAKTVLFPPAQGQRVMRRGYAVRYALTAVFVFLAIKLPFINPAAAIAPLFFPKITLLVSSIVPKKGG